MGGDRFFSGVEVEAAVGLGEELAELFLADELFASKGVEEAVAEELLKGFHTLHGHFVEGAVLIDQAGVGDNVEVRVEAEVVTEGLHSGDGGEFTGG